MDDISNAMGGEFDPHSVPESSGFGVMPAGWYPVMIEKADVKDTKAGDGKYIGLEMSVLGDSYAGRKVFANINIVNKNPTCVEIGHRDLASLALACDLTAVKSSSQLIGKTVYVKLKIVSEEKNRATGKKEPIEPRNEVAEYKNPQGGATPSTTTATPAAAPKFKSTPNADTTPKSKPAGKMPWEQ